MSDEDNKVAFSSNDPFAAATAEPVEPAPEPATPIPEPVVEPEILPIEPEPVVEGVAPVAAPEGEPPAPEVAPTDELPPLPAMTPREKQLEEQNIRLQMDLEAQRAQKTIEAQAQEAQRQQQIQLENAHIGWADRVLSDKDFEAIEIDRLGFTAYANAISWANIYRDRHERAVQDQALKAQIQSQAEIRATVEQKFKQQAAGNWATAYGKSRGLDDAQIAKVFAEHGYWANEPDIEKARLNARNALFFAAQNQGVPAVARTMVTAEQDARRKMAVTPASGGGVRQKVEDPLEEWSDKLAAAINGPGGTIFK